MRQAESTSIIHRKARVGREDFDARAMSSSKALRLSLAKTADVLFDLALSVLTVEQRRIAAPALGEHMGEEGLLVILDGAAGLRGAVWLDPQIIAGLIEAQITGAVRRTPARPRSYTRTDAAMAARYLDAVLACFDAMLGEHQAGYTPLALRFGDRIEDARVLALTLDGGQFDLFRITVDLADGAKTGRISFVLPQRAAPTAEGGRPEPSDRFRALAPTVLHACATLDAVLARLDMPLREICALKPGMTVPIPAEALGETRLYGPNRHLVAMVRLGQLNGQRAVRLLAADDTKQEPPEHPADQDAALAADHDPPSGLASAVTIRNAT